MALVGDSCDRKGAVYNSIAPNPKPQTQDPKLKTLHPNFKLQRVNELRTMKGALSPQP